MTFINVTPHALNIVANDGTVVEIKSSGLARCAQTVATVGCVVLDGHDVDVTSVQLGAVEGLPDAQDGVAYIVSRPVAEALKGSRDDLYIPGLGVRDKDGKIIGCKGLSRI